MGKRSLAATNELVSTLSTKVVSPAPIPPRPVAADPSCPALSRDVLHLARTVWAQDDAQTHCSELCNWATSSFDLSNC